MNPSLKVLTTWFLVAGIIVLVGVIDYANGWHFLQEDDPKYSLYFLFRTLIAFAVAATAVVVTSRTNGAGEAGLPAMTPWPTVFCAWVAIVATAAASLLLVFRPDIFNLLAVEDSFFEWGSALFLLAGSVIAALGAIRTARSADRKTLIILGALGLAFLLFLTGMEEISWGQRIFGFETPAEIKTTNMQGEFNLHNLATSKVENLYYAGSFAFLVILPFISLGEKWWKHVTPIRYFLPSTTLVVAGALTTSFSLQMWNIWWVQVAFFCAVLIMGAMSIRASGSRTRSLLICGILALVGAQIADLGFGGQMTRNWDDTEFKELLIAFALFSYAVELYVRMSPLRLAPDVTRQS